LQETQAEAADICTGKRLNKEIGYRKMQKLGRKYSD